MRQRYSQIEDERLNMIATGSLLGAYTLYSEEQAQIAEYASYTKEIQNQRIQAIKDNELLKEVIEYENAVVRLAKYILSEWVSEIINEDTGEILLHEIHPIPVTITDSENKIIENHLVVQDIEERKVTKEIVDNVSQDVLDVRSEYERN